jgi:hypothetical protein
VNSECEGGRRGGRGRTEDLIDAPTYSKTFTLVGRVSYASKSSSVAFFAIGEDKEGKTERERELLAVNSLPLLRTSRRRELH